MTGAAELIERETAHARLEAALAQARAGAGRIVSLEGEAGIGKSSLLLAFVDAHRADTRVHMGGCEHLATPEPMGPLRDIARESQGRFSISPTGQLATYEALLRLLTGGKGPGLLALEDIHWADDATLDLLRFLARRIRTAPVMVLVTFRTDEPQSSARLASLWADMPRDARERIELEPLSAAAVARLARRRGRLPAEVFQATGGNPFHVTEYLAYERDVVPRTVQEVTVARAARLSPHARRTLECASIFPRQIDEETLRNIASDHDHKGVEECLATGMLNARGAALAFRHELARRAVNESLSPLRRRELHTAALVLLKGREGARAAEIAHHAEQAGSAADLVRYAIRAAEEAGALGAYGEAVAHLSRAIEHGGFADGERAQLLERKAFCAHFCGEFLLARQALDEAIAIHRRVGNVTGLGNALRISAHVQWNLGDPDLCQADVEAAVRVLRAEPDSWQYAMALASKAQFDMLADRNDEAIAAAEEALARAEKLGRTDIYLQALTYLRTTRASTNLDEGAPAIRETIEEARARGELDALPRLYSNLTSIMTPARRHEGLLEALDEGQAACAARDQLPLEAFIRGNRAAALLDMGRLEEALTEAEDVVFGPYPRVTVGLSAMIALSRVRVRLGLPEGGLLDQARKLPTAQRDLLRRVPIALADAEAHWLGGSRPGAVEQLAEVHAQVVRSWSQLWNIGETALWLAILGRPPALEPKARAQLSPAHQAHVEGRWREAAELWAARGCPYEQAIALSDGDEAAQRQALAIFDRLGAAPAARKLRRRMRAEGVRSVPAGPRAARREDPAGLTPRQREVLSLLSDGLANAEIADRLGLSAKTVEHHVGAILAALEAPSRLAAVSIARERGLHEPAGA
ncbi:ATP-binding protein [Phenylobacterium terrae]|uniref:ATP-binding protein n=1 Tax=Phenylobacterium terrae TaxID=2665495 RepID=A0ABW4MXR6_9CAUL